VATDSEWHPSRALSVEPLAFCLAALCLPDGYTIMLRRPTTGIFTCATRHAYRRLPSSAAIRPAIVMPNLVRR